MRRFIRQMCLMGSLSLMSSLALPAAGAQRSQATDDDEIVVEGVRERRREIERFVSALTEAPRRGQIARFDWAVCPVAAGVGSPGTELEFAL